MGIEMRNARKKMAYRHDDELPIFAGGKMCAFSDWMGLPFFFTMSEMLFFFHIAASSGLRSSRDQ